MKIYDISLKLHNDMLVWRGDPKPHFKKKTSVAKDGVALSWFAFSSHTGTHIDAPSHFLEEGTGIDAIDIYKLVGPCKVLDLTKIDHLEITVADLRPHDIQKGDRILFKTGNYKLLKNKEFPEEYVSLSIEGAEYLVGKEVVLVGTDFLGIEKEKNPGHPVHAILLRAGIVNVEGLDLSDVPAGEYELVCLPLRVSSDGSPARAILIKK